MPHWYLVHAGQSRRRARVFAAVDSRSVGWACAGADAYHRSGPARHGRGPGATRWRFGDLGRGPGLCRVSVLDASVEEIDLPLGLGSRHPAAASISLRLGAIAIVVSKSGVVRVFHAGHLETAIIPELWLLDRREAQRHGSGGEESVGGARVLPANHVDA